MNKLYMGIYHLTIIAFFGMFAFVVLFITIKAPDTYVTLLLLGTMYLFLIIGGSYLPLISAKAGKLQVISQGPLFDMVKEILLSIGIREPKINIYIRPHMKKPVANASIQGYSDYTIIFNEDFINRLEEDEIKAVIYHEAYHIIQKHDLIRTIIWTAFGLLPLVFLIILELFSTPEKVNLVLSITGFFMYMGAGLIVLYFFRRQEINADIYAAKKIGNSEAFINALTKMAITNKEKPESNVVRQLLATHPCLSKRINYIKRSRMDME